MTNSHSNQTTKLQAGTAFPVFEVPKFGGGTMTVGGATDGWTLLIVYRGKHCGRCKTYLGKLEHNYAKWEDAGFAPWRESTSFRDVPKWGYPETPLQDPT